MNKKHLSRSISQQIIGRNLFDLGIFSSPASFFPISQEVQMIKGLSFGNFPNLCLGKDSPQNVISPSLLILGIRSFVLLVLFKKSQKIFFSIYTMLYPAGKITEKAMWRSVFLTIWHRILNADSTKTPSSSVTF